MIDTEINIVVVSNNRHCEPDAIRRGNPNLRLSFYQTDTARANTLKIFKSMLLTGQDLSPESIEKQFDKPDLIIIEGRKSLQNAAIVEASYAEIYFCDQFDETELARAVEDYKQRKRNFGV